MNKKKRDEVVQWMAESVISYKDIEINDQVNLKKLLDDRVLTISEVAEKMESEHGRSVSKMIVRAWLFKLVESGDIDFATRHIKPHVFDKRSNPRARFVFCDIKFYDRFLEKRRRSREAMERSRQSRLLPAVEARPVIRLHPTGPAPSAALPDFTARPDPALMMRSRFELLNLEMTNFMIENPGSIAYQKDKLVINFAGSFGDMLRIMKAINGVKNGS